MILSNLELGETSISDLLKRQLVKNLPISFNSMQSNDILVNSITCVSFLKKISLKSCINLQALPLFALWLQYEKPTNPLKCLFILDFLISFVAPKWSNECLGSIEKKSKQEGSRIEKTKKKQRWRGKIIAES